MYCNCLEILRPGHGPDAVVRRHVPLVAHQAGKPVAVCGDMAADPQALPILLALGIRELSMAPTLIPETKQLIRTLNTQELNSTLDQYHLA